MAGGDVDRNDHEWGNNFAKRTFWATVVLAVLFVGAVFIFILK